MEIYWLWLIHLKGVGPATLRKLVNGLGSPMAVYAATREELLNINGLRGRDHRDIIKSAFFRYRETGARTYAKVRN